MCERACRISLQANARMVSAAIRICPEGQRQLTDDYLTKKGFTLLTAFHKKNRKTFLKYWVTIPVENVSPNLAVWSKDESREEFLTYSTPYPKVVGPHTCKTIACAGGWLSAMPEFVELGVTFNGMGAPQILPKYRTPSKVAAYLFGDENLFDAMFGMCTSEAAHTEVIHRFSTH